MKRVLLYCTVFLAVGCLMACGSSSSSSGGGGTDSGIQVVGSVTGLNASVAAPTQMVNIAKEDHDPADSSRCPTTSQSNSFSVTPTSYYVTLKKLTLLGSAATGTADYDLIDVASLAAATEVDFSTTSIFTSSTTFPPAGTYDGIEIEVYYIGMDVPMVVPAVNADNGVGTFTSASYLTRGYFQDVSNIDPRDVTIFADTGSGIAEEYWVNRQTDLPNPYALEAVTGGHPNQVLDLWSDADFWCENGIETTAGCTDGWRDPMTICTRATSNCDPAVQGTDFTFEITGGLPELVIPTGATGLYTITMRFDVTDTFTFWGDTNFSDPTTELYGTFRVGYDCGYRIMFPNVEITLASTH